MQVWQIIGRWGQGLVDLLFGLMLLATAWAMLSFQIGSIFGYANLANGLYFCLIGGLILGQWSPKWPTVIMAFIGVLLAGWLLLISGGLMAWLFFAAEIVLIAGYVSTLWFNVKKHQA